MELQTEVKEFYRKLAEVYMFGLACDGCAGDNGHPCSEQLDICAKRLQSKMQEIMKEDLVC